MRTILHSTGWILLALVAGAAFGLLFPDTAPKLAPVAKWLLQLIKMAATPLVAFAVLEAIVRHQVVGRDFLKLLMLTLFNASIALTIGLVIANVFEPGRHLQFLQQTDAPAAIKEIDFLELLGKQLPTSVIQPLADNDIMPLVLVMIAFGFAWRKVRQQKHDEPLRLMHKGEEIVTVGREIAETVLTMIVKLVPFAVFAATAKIIAAHGFAPFADLGRYVLLCLLGMCIHLLFTYSSWLLLFARMSLRTFWRHALQPVLYAFGVNSSLVALPLTLKALDELGISRRASTLVACVGTNLNNDGIILYEGFTLIALAQASGIDLSLSSQILAAIYCIVAAMGVAGVPEAGVVALTLVLGGLGLPTEALAVLLSVDWIIARMRSVLNVSSDMVGSIVIAKWLGLMKPGASAVPD